MIMERQFTHDRNHYFLTVRSLYPHFVGQSLFIDVVCCLSSLNIHHPWHGSFLILWSGKASDVRCIDILFCCYFDA